MRLCAIVLAQWNLIELDREDRIQWMIIFSRSIDLPGREVSFAGEKIMDEFDLIMSLEGKVITYNGKVISK